MKKLSKILCAILTVCMLMTIMPFGAFAANEKSVSFTDTQGSWAETYIMYWSNTKAKDGSGYVIGGYADGTFRPDDNITRGAVAAILDRAFGFDASGATKDFNDVAKGSTFYKNIMACADNGVINGYSDGSFKPGNSITRQAAIAMIARCSMSKADYAQYSDKASCKKTLTNKFSDAGDISEQFYAEFCYLCAKGALDGYNDGTVRPGQNITRAQFVKLLYAITKGGSSDPVVSGKTYTLKVILSDGSKSLSASVSKLQSSAVIVDELMGLAVANRSDINSTFSSSGLNAYIAIYDMHNDTSWDDTSKENWNKQISATGDDAIISACKDPESTTTIKTLNCNNAYKVTITADTHTFYLTVSLVAE